MGRSLVDYWSGSLKAKQSHIISRISNAFEGELSLIPLPNSVDIAYYYRKTSAVSLILSWLTIISVKFSFLALFKRVIDRLPSLIRYWWAIVIFNLAVSGYRIAIYILACPYFYTVKSCECQWSIPKCDIMQKLIGLFTQMLHWFL